MNFVAPASLDEAYAALDDEGAMCLAGGQSLVAAMNLGVASPGRLVSLRLLDELKGIEATADGGLRIGAMTTHAQLASLDVEAPGPALLAQTARQVAYPAVRSRGTIGGSVALADPAADYPVALVAMDATLEIGHRGGTRLVRAREFFRGLFETALRPGEILLAVHVPAGPPGAGVAYEKLALVAGDFAIVSVAVIGASTLDVAIGGCGPVPLRLERVPASEQALVAAAKAALSSCTPPSDHKASAQYRKRVAPELVRRAGIAAMTMTKRP